MTVDLAPDVLRIRAADGTLLGEWPYDELEAVPAPDGRAPPRPGRQPGARTARDSRPGAGRRDRQPIAPGGSQRPRRAAHAGQGDRLEPGRDRLLVGVAVWGVPRIATRLTPLIPYALELRLGELIEAQARASLDTRHAGAAFECGNAAKEKPGRAAFDKLMNQLETAAGLPIPLHPLVVRQPEANAITLPGGYIYVFQGLIDKAETPDELAGVIAHEVGHAAHRDGTRAVLQAAGLSLLFGMLLGDFVGGGAVVFAAKTILQTSYSREVETAADAYGVMLMTRIGGDARALGRFLSRIAGTTHSGPKILLDHPETRDRVDRHRGDGGISADATACSIRPDWAALKSICSSS